MYAPGWRITAVEAVKRFAQELGIWLFDFSTFRLLLVIMCTTKLKLITFRGSNVDQKRSRDVEKSKSQIPNSFANRSIAERERETAGGVGNLESF